MAGKPPRDRADAIQDAWRRELPGVPVDSIGIITRVWWAAKIFGDERRRLLADLGLDVATLDLLSTLRRAGPPYRMSPGDLAEACMVTRGAITQRVERAVNAGLVERATAGSGYHARAITLTEVGNALLDQVVDDLLRAEHRLVGHLAPERREQLAALLRELLGGLGDRSLTGHVGDLGVG
ncbi:MarR family winged helix-turn-helix transcriptional regulator [Spongiactinospora sp. TRM90649]|uniref:MarR family winged helix-turn-helix transcriptional regulator n=1 Tax=Spongiactinospora sp. TRM90649 TaxID=3031114 RepID=UPI0023F6A0D6|nr:MarR family winged helix-turn-helix transcriptional regulator [Spongiactinospora sp. TRM90649]MDF5758047.1 MarR family winged helix-turn-helix transcriptional regulator [Spongiactinospora sp. TRM90649]